VIRPDLTSGAFEIPGYRVKRSLGIVRGIVVRSRSVFGSIGASLQTLVGGDITLFTELCEKTREDAYEGVTEVLCYGTAVELEAAPH
jgi:uncharacterized protein YbjQ (UPF0145 family)